jgi:hypothetical protein
MKRPAQRWFDNMRELFEQAVGLFIGLSQNL